ncbi:MAG: serine hydrolase domain-containing protein [Flavobacteriales bacterium]|jgi:CubicO group peptidase (beta-lactamase class C family)|tara:strand:+ start:568 stop:1701 length:1134 start_codon:yes stop_codon:yes gene_type:complete
MKRLKSKIGLVLALFLIFGGFNFSSDIIYLSELVSVIYKIQRTDADITDYKFFDNIEIPKSKNPQAWPIHKNYNKANSTDKLISKNTSLGTIAFLIIKNDSIWHEKYYEGYDKNSFSNSFSMSKSIVSATMGRAIDEGFFNNINDKVGFYIPEYNEGFASELTIGDLSSMSSGMKWNESYTNIFGVTARAYVGSNLNKLIKSRPIIKKPGESFEYLSSDTQLLAMTIEKATKRKLSDLVYDWFWNPMGAENNALWQVDNIKTNTEKAYCCFNSNARDFARFGKLYKDNGLWNSKRLLDSAFVKKSLTARFLSSPQYGYGFWLGNFQEKNYFAMRGHLGQYVIVFPKENIIIVRLGRMEESKEERIYIEEAFKMLNIT